MAPVTKEPKTENGGGAAVAKPKSNGISKPKKGTSAKKDGEEKDERPSSTIKIQHIPYGFFEDQLKGYFDQFGSIRSVRVPRNEKTGKDQNYAFVTFTDDDVAAIAAETMNGYLLAQKRLLVKVLKRWEVPDFCRTGAPILARPHAGAKVRKLAEKANEEKTDEQKENAENRMVERLRKKNDALKELGVDYEVPVPAKAQRKRKSDSPAVKKAEQEMEEETEDVEEEPEPSPKKKKVTKAKATVAEKPKKAQKGKKDVEKPATPVKEDEGATTDDEPVLPVAKTAKAAKGANKKANIEEVAEKPKQTKTAKAKVAAAEKEVGSDAAPVKRSTRTNKKMVEEAIAEFEKEEEALAKLEVEVVEPVKKGKATKVSKKAKNPAPVEQEEEVAPAATEPITKKGGKATKKTAEVVEEVVQQKKAPKIAERKKKAAPTEETEDEPEPEPVVKKSKAAAKKTEVAEKKVAVAETKPKTGAKKTRK